MADSVLALEGVYKTFKKGRTPIPVLQAIDLHVERQECLCLVGESGCGKTTTGKILAGLLAPTHGRVLFEGRDTRSLRGSRYDDYRRAVQIIHQDPYASLNPAHTIYSILSFPLFRHKLVRNYAQARERVGELLEMVDLTPVADLIDKYPHQLSGGQRQRVGIARAITTDPRVIVADEAVSMVDVSIRIGLLNMMGSLQASLKAALVFITHDLALAKYFAWEGRIAVMYLGRVVEIGRTQEIIANPQHPYTRVLLSAIPEADPERTRHKQHIQLRSEDIPRLTELPPGCAFHPRCPWHIAGMCDASVPSLGRVPNSDAAVEVACHPLTRGESLRLYETTVA
jgi:peptide/nickel transport system ATP-binding protein